MAINFGHQTPLHRPGMKRLAVFLHVISVLCFILEALVLAGLIICAIKFDNKVYYIIAASLALICILYTLSLLGALQCNLTALQMPLLIGALLIFLLHLAIMGLLLGVAYKEFQESDLIPSTTKHPTIGRDMKSKLATHGNETLLEFEDPVYYSRSEYSDVDPVRDLLDVDHGVGIGSSDAKDTTTTTVIPTTVKPEEPFWTENRFYFLGLVIVMGVLGALVLGRAVISLLIVYASRQPVRLVAPEKITITAIRHCGLST